MVPSERKAGLAFLLATVLLLPSWAWAGAEIQTLEDFEKFTSSSKAVSGKFTVIEAKPGVTDGRQALQLEKESSVTISLKDIDVEKLPWLKVDVFTEDKAAPSCLRMYFKGKSFSYSITAICQPGQDTVALPLSVVCNQTGRDWPEEEVKLMLTDMGSSSITLDNVRLEGAEPPPPGAILADFGPERQAVWPGFSPSCSVISWSDKTETHPNDSGFPDPLTGDFLAPYLQDKWEDHITIESKSIGTAWLWVSHYGRYYIQPPEYYARSRGKTLLARRSTLKQLLGPEGLQEGIDGEWTPQWMEKVCVPRVVELVQVPLQPGKNQVDLCNVQLTAAAIAPAGSRTAMLAYLEKVKKDLARYHRQFVLGQRLEYRSEIQPTDEETKAGVMFFSPPRDASIRTDYLPKEDSRLKLAEGSLYNGGLALVHMAAVPLKKGVLSGSVSPLKSIDGKSIGVPAELWFLDRVPHVASAQASTIPWILCRRLTVREREVVHFKVVVQSALNAAAGDYSSTIRLNTGTSLAEIPIMVHLYPCGTDSGPTATFGVMGCDFSTTLLGPIAGPLEGKKRAQLDGKLRQEVLALGFNAMSLPSVGITTDAKDKPVVYDACCVDPLRSVQGKTMRGRSLIDFSSPLYTLNRIGVPPGGSRFERLMTEVASRSDSIVSKAGFAEPLHCVGTISDPEELEKSSAVHQSLAPIGRLATVVPDTLILKVSKEKFLKALKPVSTLLVQENGSRKYMDTVDAFLKAEEHRDFYVIFYRADEYAMGFYAWGQGARGWYSSVPFQSKPYHGFDFGFTGLLAPDADLAQPCLMLQSVLWMRQGMSDFVLASRAQSLIKQAEKAGVDSSQLQKLLDALRKESREGLPYSGAGSDDLQNKRQVILEAAAKVHEQLKK
jgi:hypothetical protein